jgi:hypothetical protein
LAKNNEPVLEFLNNGDYNRVGIGLSYRAASAQIFQCLRSPGINSASLCRVVVPTRQAWNRFLVSLKGLQIRAQSTQPGGIGSLESILGLLKGLKIRAQANIIPKNPPFFPDKQAAIFGLIGIFSCRGPPIYANVWVLHIMQSLLNYKQGIYIIQYTASTELHIMEDFTYTVLRLSITINVSFVYMARYVMVLGRQDPLRGALEGMGPGNRYFLGP